MQAKDNILTKDTRWLTQVWLI